MLKRMPGARASAGTQALELAHVRKRASARKPE